MIKPLVGTFVATAVAGCVVVFAADRGVGWEVGVPMAAILMIALAGFWQQIRIDREVDS